MGTVSWLFVLFVAVVVSFFAGRFCAPRMVRLSELEEQRDAASSELRRYKEEVGSHFETTGKLFDELTGDYRALYEHLAQGATRLGVAESSRVLQSAPEQRKLTVEDEQPPTEPHGDVADETAAQQEQDARSTTDTGTHSDADTDTSAREEGSATAEEALDETATETAEPERRAPADYAPEDEPTPDKASSTARQ